MDNLTDALRKPRDYPSRLSEPPDPEEESPEGYETPSPPSYEEAAEACKLRAKKVYDTLIQMDGRPTRPIRSTPRWKKVLVGGELCYRYAEEDETLFYDTWYGYTPGPNTCLTEAGFIVGHWRDESGRCKEELRRWQEFRDSQERRRKNATEEDTKRQQHPQDPDLTASLKKMKDWKEYQAFFQRGIDRCKARIEGARGMVEGIEWKDPEVEKKLAPSQHGRVCWLRTIENNQKWLAAEEKRLEWAKQQLPAVLSECAASLIELPTSRRQMKERSELEAKRVYTALIDTGGRPTRPTQLVPDIREGKDKDEHLHILCHWEGECSQFEEDLREWKQFLNYRQKKETDGKTKANLADRQYAKGPGQVDLWKDYRAYRRMEVDNAKQWVVFWQRQVRYFEEDENDCARQGIEGQAKRSHSQAERARSYAEVARKQVGRAEARSEWVAEQPSDILAGCAVSTTQVSTSDQCKDRAVPRKRASRSGQTTFKDLRFDQFGKSTPRSNQRPDEKKKQASANPALGPIHLLRVSKAATKEPPRLRRQSSILTKHSDSQDHGPNATTSPSLPTNAAPRRSGRLSNHLKSLGALEAGFGADLGGGVHLPPSDVTLRRSDRISKQREGMSTSTSSTAASSVLMSQTDPFRRLSRSKCKGRVAGKKADVGSAKPHGICKRQGRLR